jgi:hypothetical protein
MDLGRLSECSMLSASVFRFRQIRSDERRRCKEKMKFHDFKIGSWAKDTVRMSAYDLTRGRITF